MVSGNGHAPQKVCPNTGFPLAGNDTASGNMPFSPAAEEERKHHDRLHAELLFALILSPLLTEEILGEAN